MTCAICLAIEFASPGSKDALIVAQQRQIDRLTGGTGVEPAVVEVVARRVEAKAPPSPEGLVHDLKALLAHEDIFRKPPRVAAPRLAERLLAAGWRIERDQIEETG